MLRATMSCTASSAASSSAKKATKKPVIGQVKRVARDLKNCHESLKQSVLEKLTAIEAPLTDLKKAHQRASDERSVNMAKVTESIKEALNAEVHFGMECVQDVRSEIVKYWADDDEDDEDTLTFTPPQSPTAIAAVPTSTYPEESG